jgi:hypothetical protein
MIRGKQQQQQRCLDSKPFWSSIMTSTDNNNNINILFLRDLLTPQEREEERRIHQEWEEEMAFEEEFDRQRAEYFSQNH